MASAIKHFFGKSRKADKSDDLNGSSVAHRRASSLKKTSRGKGTAILRESSQVEGALMWEDLISSPTAKEWRPTKSPYSVVTEPLPKATKSPKSCPIGAYSHYDPRTASDHSSSQSRPPSSIPPSAAYFGLPTGRSRFPVIHESGECYENFSNIDVSRQRHNAAEQDSGRGRNFRRNGGGSLIEYRHRGDRLRLDHYRLSSELSTSRSISKKPPIHRGGRNAATSEYGSADPSPTDLLYCRRLDVLRPLENGSGNAPASEGNSDDYDSCDSDELPSDLVQLCTQQLKRANGKCKLYKQVAKRYRAKNTKLVEELGDLSEALSNEKRKNYALLHRLSQVERELEEVRCYRVPPVITQPPGDFSLGAGEALCLREDDSNGIFDPYRYHQSNNPPTQLNYSQSPSLFDELKHYRRAEEECSDSLSEFSRHKSPGTAESSNVVTSPYKLSPLRGHASDDPKAALADSNAVKSVEQRLLATKGRRDDGMMPRGLSLSDSALNKLCATENGEQEVPIMQSTAHSTLFNSSAHNDRPMRVEGGERKCSSRKYHSFKAHKPSQRADYYSSYSSDDDQAIRLMARQLRCRGEVVHFRPPRKCVEQRTYTHFGPPERQAIAQFEYLLDMSTDVSGLMSSPDPTPK